MKILFLSDYYSTWNIGGATRVLQTQMDGLLGLNEGVEQELISGYPGAEDKENYELTWYKTAYRSPIYLFYLAWMIYKRSREFKPDVVHIHQPLIGAIALLVMPRKIKRVYHFHSFWYDEKISHARGRLFQRMVCQIKKVIEDWTLRRVGNFVVLSEFSKNKLLGRKLEGQISVIPGCVDSQSWSFLERSGKSKNFNFISVRRLDPRMGLDNLLRAFAALVESGFKNIRLSIVGTGRMEEELYRLSQDLHLESYVNFEGRAEQTRLMELYRESHCMVVPTRELEGFGMVVIEALSTGLPVLANRVGGLAEFEKHQGSVHCIQADLESLEEGLKWATRHFAPQTEMNQNCRKVVLEEYEISQVSRQLHNLYKKI